jgi:hypothetical protein
VHVVDGSEARMIAQDLDKPMGIAMDGDTVYVTEAGAGRVIGLAQGKPQWTVADGFGKPEGLCFSGGKLYVVDTRARALIEIDPASGDCTQIADNLPVGAPAGLSGTLWLGPIGDMSGPMVNFADVAAAPDGTLYLSGDAEGSVLAIRPA